MMNEQEIKKEALKRYCEIVISGLPLKWVDGAIDLMLKEEQDEPTERIKSLIDFVIEETKKSLSTFPKEKEHNSSSKKTLKSTMCFLVTYEILKHEIKGLTMEKEEIYEYAIRHWGIELQMGMLTEEIGELFQVINRFRRGRITDKEQIAQEIADVNIMLEQIIVMLNIPQKSIDMWKMTKLQKLESMIRNKAL